MVYRVHPQAQGFPSCEIEIVYFEGVFSLFQGNIVIHSDFIMHPVIVDYLSPVDQQPASVV